MKQMNTLRGNQSEQRIDRPLNNRTIKQHKTIQNDQQKWREGMQFANEFS